MWAEVDVGALRRNVALVRRAAGTAAVCAVVKADAYGHGALTVASAALEGGASSLAVALVEEGLALRKAGIEAPVLVLSEPPPDAWDEAVAFGLTPTVYTTAGAAAAARAAKRIAGEPVGIHVKVDTGMHRVGADPADVVAVAAAVQGEPSLRVAAMWTHLAVADGLADDDRHYTARQLRQLREAVAAVESAGIRVPFVHAANSAATFAHPDARLDLVRCGIAVYGLPPAPAMAGLIASTWQAALEPVLSWKAKVSFVRRLAAGERPSYGRRRPLDDDAVVATVPVGYADGVPRRLFDEGGTVLIGGRRRPLAGVVTMDQIVVDCGRFDPSAPVQVGDEVVLVGSQGDASVGAQEWAELLGTISYEVLCGIGPRVPRVAVAASTL